MRLKNEKTHQTVGSFIGGPEDKFLKPSLPPDIIRDLELLYTRMVNLGVEIRDGEVYTPDLDGRDA